MSKSGPDTGTSSKAPLTHDAVCRIAGNMDDSKVAAVLATGASVEQLEEAVAWATGESDVMGDLRLPLTGRVAALYDILTADEDYGDERD